jgi:glutamine synthetase
MLMAGLDGIKNKIDPGAPLDKDIFELEPHEAAKIPSMSGSLDEALGELQRDHNFLLEGGVFTEEFVELWINYKKKNEADPVRMRPHPYEFHLYYDI